jgi:hypothetical protein
LRYPIHHLVILGDGVNFLNNLGVIYTTFVYIICGIKYNLTEKGFALFTMGDPIAKGVLVHEMISLYFE